MTWDEFWEEAEKCEDAQRPSAAGCSLPTLSQAIAWAHVRQHALQEIREKYPDHPAAVIAGKAMCIGPGSTGLASMANAAMERQ